MSDRSRLLESAGAPLDDELSRSASASRAARATSVVAAAAATAAAAAWDPPLVLRPGSRFDEGEVVGVAAIFRLLPSLPLKERPDACLRPLPVRTTPGPAIPRFD